MNFIVGLPGTSCGYNSMWVIVDVLTKSAHFIPVSTLTFFRQGNQCQTSPPLPLLQSRDEISFKGEGCNTLCYELPNHGH
jgi:hypothetical protein